MRRPGWLGIVLIALAGCGGPESTAPRPDGPPTPGDTVELVGLKSKVPAKWVAEPVKSEFRLAQYRLDEETEVVVYHRITGSAKENVTRWKSMFSKTDREPTVETFKVGPLEMVMLDATGTYQNAMNPRLRGQPHENFRQVAVYIDSRKGPFQIIMTGPAEAVGRHKADFDAWLKGFK